MTDLAARRAAIVAEARSWIGTPYHSDAAIKGVGVDCARFVAEVYVAAGIVPRFAVPDYPPDWFLHSDDERLKRFVESLGVSTPVAESDVGPGDLALYRIGRSYAHCAIVVDWPREIVHAHLLSKCVRASGAFDADLRRRRDVLFYAVKG